MPKEQIIIGAIMALLCLNGLWLEQRVLTQTRKGQQLVRWFGEARALWVLRILLMGGAIFGLFLATNVIRPVRW